jgi:diguanylate cyclase (GGDEF)-like protein/PAS domain S-box-containing protein
LAQFVAVADGKAHLPQRRRVLAAAIAAYAIVFALRELGGAPGDGVTFLYVIPIILIANEFGARAGALAGLVAVALFFLWDVTTSNDVSLVAYLTRIVSFVVVGVLTGRNADRLRASADEAATGARHFELARDLLCTANRDGYLVHLNGAWEETLGWSREELMAKPFVEFVHPDDQERTRRSAAALQAGERTERLLNRYCTKDGGYRWIEWSSSFDAEHGLIYAAARDLTERLEAEQKLHEADELFRRSFEDSPLGTAVVGLRGDDADRILEVNDALIDLTGLSREDLVGISSLAELIHLDDVEFVRDGLERLQRGEIPVLRMEFRMRGLAGQVRWMDLTASIVNGADDEPLYRITQIQDVDARRRGEDQLRHLADHDALSGLFNRRRFHEELGRELERGGRGALMLIDLDKFKEVNDTLGHAAGDAVIKSVGAALIERLRTSDVTARLGGDEFGIMLRRVTASEAERVAVEVLDHVEARVQATPEGAQVSLSIGVATFEAGDARDPDELLRAADEAMYRAKSRGGSAVARAG